MLTYDLTFTLSTSRLRPRLHGCHMTRDPGAIAQFFLGGGEGVGEIGGGSKSGNVLKHHLCLSVACSTSHNNNNGGLQATSNRASKANSANWFATANYPTLVL